MAWLTLIIIPGLFVSILAGLLAGRQRSTLKAVIPLDMGRIRQALFQPARWGVLVCMVAAPWIYNSMNIVFPAYFNALPPD